MLDKVHILFSGFNQRAIISFLRTLTRYEQPYIIVARSDEDPILLTEYRHNVVLIRKTLSLDFENMIDCIRNAKKKIQAREYIISPSTEALNRFFLKYQIEFNQLGCTIPLVNKNLYERISDKYSFGKLCKNYGIKIPSEYNEFEEAQIPFVAKPKRYFAADGSVFNPFLILSEKDRLKFKNECKSSDFFYQEFVTGRSLYLLYYFHRDGRLFKFSQENFIQQPHGKSIVAAVSSSFHQTDESKKYERLLQSLNFHGLIMIEVKRQNKENFMIEANPRFWGPSQLFVDAGTNFFEAYLHDSGSLNAEISFSEPEVEVKYFWFGGLLEILKTQNAPAYHNYTEQDMINEMPIWLQSDIYSKPDTFDVFINELK